MYLLDMEIGLVGKIQDFEQKKTDLSQLNSAFRPNFDYHLHLRALCNHLRYENSDRSDRKQNRDNNHGFVSECSVI